MNETAALLAILLSDIAVTPQRIESPGSEKYDLDVLFDLAGQESQ